MSKINKIYFFTKGLKPNIFAEVNYYSPEELEDAMKMTIQYNNAIFQKDYAYQKSQDNYQCRNKQ